MKFLVFKNRNEFYLGQYKEENNSIDRFDTPKGVAQNDGVTYLIGRELPPVIDKLSLNEVTLFAPCLLYTSPSPRDATLSGKPSSA